MVNPAIELRAKKQQFISIRELIIRIEKNFPNMTRDEIANWLLIKIDEAGQYSPNLLIQDAKGITRRPVHGDPPFSSYEILSQVMVDPAMEEPLYDGWSPRQTDPNDEVISSGTTDMPWDSDIPF